MRIMLILVLILGCEKERIKPRSCEVIDVIEAERIIDPKKLAITEKKCQLIKKLIINGGTIYTFRLNSNQVIGPKADLQIYNKNIYAIEAHLPRGMSGVPIGDKGLYKLEGLEQRDYVWSVLTDSETPFKATVWFP